MWIGGANLPMRYMRVNATRPLARLSVDGGKIEIGFRPRLVAQVFRAGSCQRPPMLWSACIEQSGRPSGALA